MNSHCCTAVCVFFSAAMIVIPISYVPGTKTLYPLPHLVANDRNRCIVIEIMIMIAMSM